MARRKLLLPTDDAGKRLREQIEKGRQLLGQSVNSHAELRQYKLDRLRYTQYNIEMLNALFGKDEDSFWKYKISSPINSWRPPLDYWESVLENAKLKPDAAIDKLNALFRENDLKYEFRNARMLTV